MTFGNGQKDGKRDHCECGTRFKERPISKSVTIRTCSKCRRVLRVTRGSAPRRLELG